ncbi:STAS-like domain-containing protein [Algoriphagus aestuarii]|nr:STAS-like domain-containing protein [Algoriphagus aestuarii]
MIKIREILSKNIAILHSDGLKVYNAIMEELAQDKHFKLSFEGITTSTTAFLNASIGKLLMNSPEALNKMEIVSAEESVLEKIEWVKENALDTGKRVAREDAMREYLEHI